MVVLENCFCTYVLAYQCFHYQDNSWLLMVSLQLSLLGIGMGIFGGGAALFKRDNDNIEKGKGKGKDNDNSTHGLISGPSFSFVLNSTIFIWFTVVFPIKACVYHQHIQDNSGFRTPTHANMVGVIMCYSMILLFFLWIVFANCLEVFTPHSNFY